MLVVLLTPAQTTPFDPGAERTRLEDYLPAARAVPLLPLAAPEKMTGRPERPLES